MVLRRTCAPSCRGLVRVLCIVLLTGGLGQPVAAGVLRVSVTGEGRQGAGMSWNTSVSADGRYVAFESYAPDLVPGDTNGRPDLFVKDLVTGGVRRVSISSTGEQCNGGSWNPQISPDGRHVAFESSGSNLVPGDGNGYPDVFVADLVAGGVRCASAGRPGGSWSDSPSLSADGRYVAFRSEAGNLVPGDTNGAGDAFVTDLVTGAVRRISLGPSGEQGDGLSGYPSLSADGRQAAFVSWAGNLVPGDTNGVADVFVLSLVTGDLQRASVSASGDQGDGPSHTPTLNADGRFIAFESRAANLVPGDTNGEWDTFVKDLWTGTIQRASTAADGRQANGWSFAPSLSADGRFVAFESWASNLVPGDTNGEPDIFVKDLRTGAIRRVSIGASGQESNGRSDFPALSADGRLVAFESKADNLVPGDTNGAPDVFVATTGFEQALAKGDLDGDGRSTMADVILALRLATGLGLSGEAQAQAADVDCDGGVTAADVLWLLRRVLGSVLRFPCEPEG